MDKLLNTVVQRRKVNIEITSSPENTARYTGWYWKACFVLRNNLAFSQKLT